LNFGHPVKRTNSSVSSGLLNRDFTVVRIFISSHCQSLHSNQAPSPRSSHCGWSHGGRIAFFGGEGDDDFTSPDSPYLRGEGEYEGLCNNQLVSFEEPNIINVETRVHWTTQSGLRFVHFETKHHRCKAWGVQRVRRWPQAAHTASRPPAGCRRATGTFRVRH
jgi:hypothetical protein